MSGLELLSSCCPICRISAVFPVWYHGNVIDAQFDAAESIKRFANYAGRLAVLGLQVPLENVGHWPMYIYPGPLPYHRMRMIPHCCSMLHFPCVNWYNHLFNGRCMTTGLLSPSSVDWLTNTKFLFSFCHKFLWCTEAS